MSEGRRLLALLAMAAIAACASSPPDNTALPGSRADIRIQDGLARLGASEERGECFARRIAGSLDADDAAEAADIVDISTSRDDMRERVLAANGRVKRAFIGANIGCSLFG